MLANKDEAAFELLELNTPLSVPAYIREAVTSISA